MRGRLLAVLASAAAVAAVVLAFAASAGASVRLVSVTSPASPGGHATLVARISLAGATCAIAVLYESGASSAQGLYPKRPSSGTVSWTWMVGTRTTPGRWPIIVSCGRAGTLQTSFVVR